MKNKKIILGLGTITALGAMSVGFIACVKEKEVKAIVDEKTKDLSKLTEEQIKKIINEAGYSKLTEDQIKKIIDSHPFTKAAWEMSKHIFAKFFEEEVLQHLSPNPNKEEKKSKINIGHFKRHSKVQDVINKIKELIKTKANWEIVENSQRDDFGGEKNGKELTQNNTSIKFKLKTKLLDRVIETGEIEFNFVVGRSNFKQLIGANKEVNDDSFDSIEKLIEALNERPEFKNINLTSNDLEIDGTITPTTTTKKGEIKVKVKNTSIKLEQDDESVITFEINQKRTALNQTSHLSGLTLDWTKSEANIKAQILKKINEHNDFANNNLGNDDLKIVVNKPTHLYRGQVTITPKKNSNKVKGETIKFEKEKLTKLSLEKKLLGDNFEAKNDTKKQDILNKLKETNTLITTDDFIFEITKATNQKEGTIKIKATADSVIVSGNFEISIKKTA